MSFGDKQISLLNRCVDSISSYRDIVSEYLEGNDKNDGDAFVQKIAKHYTLLDKDVKKSKNIFNQINSYCLNNDSDFNCDVDKMFEEYCTQYTSTSNVEDSEIYQKILNRTDPEVQEVRKKSVSRLEETEYESVNDSVLCAEVFKPPIDPISKTIVKDPYKNVKCGHVYEFKFILEYIKKRGNKARCPIVGCRNNELAVAHLRKDEILGKKITEYLANHTSSQDSDDDSA